MTTETLYPWRDAQSTTHTHRNEDRKWSLEKRPSGSNGEILGAKPLIGVSEWLFFHYLPCRTRMFCRLFPKATPAIITGKLSWKKTLSFTLPRKRSYYRFSYWKLIVVLKQVLGTADADYQKEGPTIMMGFMDCEDMSLICCQVLKELERED